MPKLPPCTQFEDHIQYKRNGKFFCRKKSKRKLLDKIASINRLKQYTSVINLNKISRNSTRPIIFHYFIQQPVITQSQAHPFPKNKQSPAKNISPLPKSKFKNNSPVKVSKKTPPASPKKPPSPPRPKKPPPPPPPPKHNGIGKSKFKSAYGFLNELKQKTKALRENSP